jgi:hypothetical protein
MIGAVLFADIKARLESGEVPEPFSVGPFVGVA